MAEHVRLTFDGDGFTGRLAQLAKAAAELDRALNRSTLAAATWEPHDWTDFD